MPLEQRVIKPILISRSTLPFDSQGNPLPIPSELECVTNGTLANIIRQLSSLSKYAEDLFAGILHEATLLIARSTSLQGRIDRVAVRVTQLDSAVEEVSLKDIQLKKPFKSCASYDQQVVARTTMPESIKEVYVSCDRPPPLEKLNAYRDDGKDGLKFYTDPGYFFDLWAKEMLEATEKEKSGKKNAHRGPNKGQGDTGPNERRRVKPRQPQNTAREIMAKIPATEFIEPSRLQQQPSLNQSIYQHHNGPIQGVGHYGQPQHYSQTLERPRSLGINQFQVDEYHHIDQVNMPQTIPNHPPPAYYPPGSMMMQNPYHTGNMSNQGAINQISSPGRSSHTPPPSYFANSVNGPVDSMVTTNQMSGSQQQNQGTPTRRNNNAQASASSLTGRPSQPPPAPPNSNPPSSNGSSNGTPTVGTPTIGSSPAGTSTVGTPSRTRGPSLTRESLPPPPPPPPPPSSGMNEIGGRDSIDSELPLPPPTASVPPPPPPPPPQDLLGNTQNNNVKNGLTAGPNLAQEILQKQSQVMQSKTSTISKVLPQHVQQNNGRDDLLAAIREGIILRKVDENKQKQAEKSTQLLDVASILARRKAMEFSDSESEAEEESGSDNWNDDESVC